MMKLDQVFKNNMLRWQIYLFTINTPKSYYKGVNENN